MAFITAEELVGTAETSGLLPANTAVTLAEANTFINSAKMRLAESHAPDSLPENAITKELVEELAYAKALKRHYIKGEAEIDTEPLDKDIERVEKRFDVYDAHHTTPAEQASESPVAYVSKVPW